MLVANDLVVRGTLVGTSGTGQGIYIDNGGQASLTRTLVDQTTNIGLLASTSVSTVTTPTMVDLSDVVVRNSIPSSPGASRTNGYGIVSQQRAVVTATRVMIAHIPGIAAAANAGSLDLTDLTELDASQTTGPDPGISGDGLFIGQLGGDVTLTRGSLADNVLSGALGGSGTMHLSDITVQRTSDGSGIQAQGGVQMQIDRALIEDTHGTGLSAGQDGTVVMANDVTVHTVHPRPSDGHFGQGISAALGADLTVKRAVVEDCEVLGVGADGATVHFEDLVVNGTRQESTDGRAGHGLQAQNGATVDVTRASFEDNHECGLYLISPMTHGTFEDVVVKNTLGATKMGVDGFYGEALMAYGGATAEVTRARFEGNHEASVESYLLGSDVKLTDVRVLDTQPRECASTGVCPGMGAGTGLDAIGQGTIEATHFEIRGSVLCGVQVAPDPSAMSPPTADATSIDLHDGVIADNLIGVNVEVDGFDLNRLMDEVRYVNNQTPLDSTTLPVPQPSMFMPDLSSP